LDCWDLSSQIGSGDRLHCLFCCQFWANDSVWGCISGKFIKIIDMDTSKYLIMSYLDFNGTKNQPLKTIQDMKAQEFAKNTLCFS
jgi:hypothetical protein